jgi:hypothetical protein
MKRRLHGPSLYYASDKNIFDALNQHKVDISTIMGLFERRNIIISPKTPRDELAKYFARQIHDYHDHKDISARLGIAPRRERITSMDVVGEVEREHLQVAVHQIKAELEAAGETVRVSRDGERLSLDVEYSTVDYKVSEFAQRQVRDGTIEFIESEQGYTVRNTHNDYLNDVRDTVLSKIEKAAATQLTKTTVTLFDVPLPKLRSNFFHELVFNLQGYQHRDVTAVYVYKGSPRTDADSSKELEENDDETHVERVHLRGRGVTRSELLSDLGDDDYYITKIAWRTAEVMGDGREYDIEATFADPKDCTGFSFLLSGVYPFEDGKVLSRRRAPQKAETDTISRAIESKARDLTAQMRKEYALQSPGAK